MKPTVIAAPQFGVNDPTASLVSWNVDAGEQVSKGAILCELETAKASFEIEAPQDGVVLPLVEVNTEVAVNQPLALMGSELASLKQQAERLSASASQSASLEATEKAKKLAADLNIDLSAVRPAGSIIRETDIRAHARKSETDPFELKPVSGELDPEFLRAITDDPEFLHLPSEQKLSRYREAGAVIGEGVKIGLGALVLADRIELQDNVEIGAGTHITAESLAVGKMSVIGRNCTITCRHVQIGDVFYSASEIIIGGADRFSKTDKLIIGDQCLVSARCFLDTGNGIYLGNEVALSPFVKLYTHQYWQNVLEGYHSSFGPIVIEDNAYVTGDCLVTPGVRIGAGATILANSTVAGNVDPFTIVSGNPARPVGKVEQPQPPDRKERIVKSLLRQMKEDLAERIPDGAVIYQRKFDPEDRSEAEVILTFDCAGHADTVEGVVLFDLTNYHVYGQQTPTSDEARNFLRRRGVRFAPIHWRYGS